TLKAYLGEGSLKDAAAALGLHRHTVLYRLEKLKELIPGGLEDPDSQQRIRLAIALSTLL
ncbi:MAG TPA: helix-turn-helix domain-containing protein, partial [Chloroflexota bacterium]|nr:helix-turn-helix domain-containing protein [Chloroflexota bacterium]